MQHGLYLVLQATECTDSEKALGPEPNFCEFL